MTNVSVFVVRRPVNMDQPRLDEEEDLPCSTHSCVACSVGALSLLIGIAAWAASGPIDPLDARVVAFSRDGVLRTVVWAGRAGGSSVLGPNGPETDWAVFFYKPYCGACKRVWPAFRALAATTNSSGRLRFGEVDCVRDQHVCSMMGADRHPLVRLYKATGGLDARTSTSAFKREVAAEWQGMLIAYELVSWFTSLQQGAQPLVHKSVAWPDEQELGEAMRRFRVCTLSPNGSVGRACVALRRLGRVG